MGLEDILRQNAEITEFLKSLMAAHRKALQDQSLSSQLDDIRRDILICFNDLYTLNEMLISCDGHIKEEIEMLQKAKEKFAKLSSKKRHLLQERDKWNQKVATRNVSNGNDTVTIDSGYRRILNQYLELVGASNTTLVDKEVRGEIEETNGREELLESLQLLQTCHDRVSQNIKQLKQLLKDFSKDQTFIEREIRSQSLRVRHETNYIEEELNRVSVSRKKLLAKVGLALPDSQDTSISGRLFQLKLNHDKEERLRLEQDDIADHANEFIDMKITSLQDQLTHKKEDSTYLANQRISWDACIQSVKGLEDRIRLAMEDNAALSDIPPKTLKLWLQESIGELNSLIASTDNDSLITLMKDEREVIEKAYHEISNNRMQTQQAPKGTVDSPSPPRNSHSDPPFLVASKSPPDISVSEKTAKPLHNENPYGSSSLALLKDKSQKKD